MSQDSLILPLVNLWVRMRYPKQGWREVRRCGRLAAIADPRRANEKFLWRHAFDHDPHISKTYYRLAAKAFVAKLSPERCSDTPLDLIN